LPEAKREGGARRLAQEESQRPFDLTQGPLLRGCLLWVGDQDHFLLVTLHHIISDGWSLGVLVHELAVLYDAFATGAPSPLPTLPIQYADFSHWQRQWRHNAVLAAQLAYWTEQLRDPLPVLELPTDRPRGTTLHVRTARQPLEIPDTLFETLRDRSRQEGSTLRYSAQTLSVQAMEQGVIAPDVALTTFDIILTLRESPQGVTGTCLYKADLLDAATITRMLDNFQEVLACLSAQPEQALATFRSFSLRDAHG
jgi:hypothetical protein